MPRPLPNFSPETSREPPISVWLHIGPASLATVTVSFPGTYKTFSLTKVQAQRLRAALDHGISILVRDDGDRRTRQSINLLEGIDA
ncbi:MAG: hypothetical protein HY834_09040 [Devosia nanyangense]|uniref:Uncharacterized protein n=1 Tax=Devosia nanyangense TaxID=1228055 RepID=A0A933L3N9_9HYPH|nr:hypothetical protein [Devosia nanyangense]